jgi:hypothetical protein
MRAFCEFDCFVPQSSKTLKLIQGRRSEVERLKYRYECLMEAELDARSIGASGNELIIFAGDVYRHLLGGMRPTSLSLKY